MDPGPVLPHELHESVTSSSCLRWCTDLSLWFLVVFSFDCRKNIIHISQRNQPFHKNQQDSKAALNLSKDVGCKTHRQKKLPSGGSKSCQRWWATWCLEPSSWILGEMEGFPESHEGWRLVALRILCRCPERCLFSFEFLEDQYIFQDITAILFRCFGGNPWKSQWCHVFDVFCFFVRVECCLRTNQHHSLFGFIKAAPHVRLSERALYPLYIPSRKTDNYLSFFSHFFGGNY